MRWACFIGLIVLAGGCVQRRLTVTSEPPGALVYLNGDEVGRTPITRDFTWYGTYDVELRKEGYQTLKTRGKVIAPWWQWVPIDLFAELFPATDHHQLDYHLEPTVDIQEDPKEMLDRAQGLQAMLESSEYTTTRPTTRPTTKPTSRPTTRHAKQG